MAPFHVASSALAFLIPPLLFSLPAYSADVTGAWATDASACKNIFVKGKSGLSLARTADLHGSGFIIEKDRIKGKMVACNIRSRKEDGAILHLIATCSTDVALGPAQFSLRIINDKEIMRLYPGLPELDMAYHRCSL
jgi:hypothetical protein